MNDQTAATALSALGNSNRVKLIRILVRAGDDGMNVTGLREHIGLPASTMNHHLRMLADAGLIKQVRMGRELVSYAAFKQIRALNTFLMKDCCKDAFVQKSVA